ncbi:4-hydroxy-2-oxovalerate aldolase [Candidatus Micrarchaeota archaeon]|nr:4-hydroxy-2-oxovalerate aldolase [Candidatus Micrarchaeota archaeon]
MKKINILEVTLRDGSYAINFSFTAADTANICKKLEEIGFEYIEIGHGIGLNASNFDKYGRAVATDEEYMIAAEGALKKAKYGMFCIPGIAKLEDLDVAAKHNMGFVRIGTNVTQIEESESFIKKAKDNGFFVGANFMKSYALPPEKFAEKVKLSEKYGADMVYLVDSSGGMFSNDIRRYYEAIRKVSDIPLGFHGHDNLGLALSNSLEAIELGFEFIDSSMQGLGRSSGNTATELLVAALIKKKQNVGIDFLKLLNAGHEYITPLLKTRGRAPLDIISGYADFHSSYMHKIHKYSSAYNIDPALLIIELCKIDKVNADDKLLEEIAKRIKKEESICLTKYGFDRYFGGEQDDKR